MSDTLTLQAAELSLVEGERRQHPPEMAWVETERGTLYVLVELSAPAELWDEVSELLVESAVEGFLLADGSDSLALNRATEAVNRALQLENEELSREDQVWAGLNMALMRTGTTDLYLAQAGPALTYLARRGRYKQFPEANGDGKSSGEMVPLGDTGQPRVRLAKFTLEPDDIVVLSATHLPQIVTTEREMRRTITQGSAEDVADGLARLATGHDYSALILHPLSASQQSQQPSGSAKQQQLPLSSQSTESEPETPAADDRWWYGDVAEATREEKESPSSPADAAPQRETTPPAEESKPPERPSERKRPSRRPSSQEPAREQQRDAPASPTASHRTHRIRPRRPPAPPPREPSILATTAERVQVWAHGTVESARSLLRKTSLGPVKRVIAIAGAFLLLLLAFVLRAIEWGLQIYSRYILPGLRRLIPLFDRLALVLVAGLIWLWRRAVAILRHMLPGVSPAEESADRSLDALHPSDEGRALFPVLAILIPIVIVLASAGWYWQSSGTDGERYTQLVAEVQTSIAQAEEADREAAVILLQGVEDDLAEAAQIRPNADEVQALQARYNAVLERVAGVTRVSATPIAPISSDAAPANLVLQGNTLYVLDRNSGNVYTVDPGTPQSSPVDTGEPLMGPGKPALGPIYFITRMPPGGTRTEPAIVGLTETGLVEYSEQRGVRKLEFAAVTGRMVSIDHYGGHLYLLDRENTQIWKYAPDANGEYSTQPEAWIQAETRESLGTLAEFAIDGDIFVIDDSGTVVKMTVGERRPFTLEPAVPALRTPVALFTDERETDVPLNYLYVGETNRVLVYDKSENGALLAHYRPGAGQEWGQIFDVVADETNNEIYILTAQAVLRIPLDVGQ